MLGIAPLSTLPLSALPDSPSATVTLAASSPSDSRIGYAQFSPNLLLTTLAALAILPPGQQVSASTPTNQTKYQVQVVEQAPSRLTLGMNPQPLVLRLDASTPPPKFTVQVDQPLFHPLTLGMNPQPRVQRLDASAPPPKYAVQVDQPLFHPLDEGINPQPVIQRLDASAPPPKAPVYVDQPLQTPLTLGMNPQPQIKQWDASAPPRSPVYVDQPLFHPLTLGMNPQPQVRQLDLPAPAVVRTVQADVYPNLSVTTLASAAVQNPFKPLDTSQAQPKYQVFAEQYVNTLAIGYNPQPQIQRLDQSAPPPKTPVYVGQPTFHPLTLGMNPQPQVQRLDQSAPPPKYQVFIDQPTFHPLTLGMNPQPVVQQLSSAAPLRQFAVQTDVYPNLSVTTLGIVPAPFKPVDTSQIQAKYQVFAEQYVNTLAIGYNPQPKTSQLDGSAPPMARTTQVDVYPNLLATTLGQPPAVPFTPIDSLQFQAKYQVVTDLPTNILVLGYPPPPPVVVSPPAGGGLLPGWLGEHSELGKGMGPYKRPGQVFGEPPVPSPYMGSQRAPRARPPTNLQQLPLELEPITEPQLLNFEIEVAMLLAMDEAHKPAGVLIRGPLTVTIVRKV